MGGKKAQIIFIHGPFLRKYILPANIEPFPFHLSIYCYFVSVSIAIIFIRQKQIVLPSEQMYFFPISQTPPRLLQVLDSIYFSRRFHVRCVAQARDKAGHLGTPLRSNIATIGTEGSICHTPVTTGTARGFQAQSFVATLKYLDVKHKQHPNRWVGGVSACTSQPYHPPPPPTTPTCIVYCSTCQLVLCLVLVQHPHLGADPSPGRHAPPSVHHATAQPALPAV